MYHLGALILFPCATTDSAGISTRPMKRSGRQPSASRWSWYTLSCKSGAICSSAARQGGIRRHIDGDDPSPARTGEDNIGLQLLHPQRKECVDARVRSLGPQQLVVDLIGVCAASRSRGTTGAAARSALACTVERGEDRPEGSTEAARAEVSLGLDTCGTMSRPVTQVPCLVQHGVQAELASRHRFQWWKLLLRRAPTELDRRRHEDTPDDVPAASRRPR
jgi:hypothetical protein